MANTTSAKKAMRQSKAKHDRNVARKSAIKTALKKLQSVIQEKNAERAKELFKEIESKMIRAASKGVIHKNTASRKISRVSKQVAAIQ